VAQTHLSAGSSLISTLFGPCLVLPIYSCVNPKQQVDVFSDAVTSRAFDSGAK
jgi:hypothetical protein